MTEIRVASGTRVWTGPVGGDGPYTELGYTTEGMPLSIEDDQLKPYRDALDRYVGLTARTITMQCTLNRRQYNRLYRIMTGGRRLPRNRRRNPLYAVRDQLRRERRWRR